MWRGAESLSDQLISPTLTSQQDLQTSLLLSTEIHLFLMKWFTSPLFYYLIWSDAEMTPEATLYNEGKGGKEQQVYQVKRAFLQPPKAMPSVAQLSVTSWK